MLRAGSAADKKPRLHVGDFVSSLHLLGHHGKACRHVRLIGVLVAIGPTCTSRLRAHENYLASLTWARRGLAIVIKPASGEVLAASNLQKAVEDAYPAGSTAEIVLGAAALEESLFSMTDAMIP